ncbi:MAG: SH3 domain-containing protein [Chloroflexi bacterium]|nr:SH3 domain-containing protein [Chloroflexota bacterium]MCL5074114.1 SH3 domain-containing protein [Chloroflexota bacterium]
MFNLPTEISPRVVRGLIIIAVLVYLVGGWLVFSAYREFGLGGMLPLSGPSPTLVAPTATPTVTVLLQTTPITRALVGSPSPQLSSGGGPISQATAVLPSPAPTLTVTPTRPSPTATVPSPTPIPTPTSTPTPAGGTTPGKGIIRTVGGVGAIIRSQPSTPSTALGVVPYGAQVELLRIVRGQAIDPLESRWYEITYGSMHGYIYYKLVTPVQTR